MINKIPKNYSDTNINIENEPGNESQKETKKIDPFKLLSKEFDIINEDNEDDFTPIMSKINKDKREKRPFKLNKIDEHRAKKFSDFFKIRDARKLSFTKLSHKEFYSPRLNTLLSLNPFCTDFKENFEKNAEEYLNTISEEFIEEKYKENNIIYQYGDEADKFFVIYKGSVSLFFPFTEIVNMNIDEFYIYILRLRRYNEIEMLNNVLLLNKGLFLIDFDEKFVIDDYIIKLYNTSLKIKFDATFVYQDRPKKKITKIKLKNQEIKNKSQNQINNKNKANIKQNKPKDSSSQSTNKNQFVGLDVGFDDNLFKTINDKNVKECVVRIEEEIVETMRWIYPEKIYKIIEIEEEEEEKTIKKLVQIPEELINAYKKYNPNIVKGTDYIKRILPPKINNKKLKRQEAIIMKYLNLSNLSKGNYFGDFGVDSLSLFCPKYLNIAKSCNVSIKMHKFFTFRNMTSISNSSFTSLLSFNKKIFYNYISKFIEKKTLAKKKYLINHPLFVNSTCLNLLKTYSICFNEKKIKDGEIIIKENEKLNETNSNIHFIIKGEFESFCKKNIFQIDEVIKLIGYEKNIIDTFPKILKGLLGTKYYNDIANKNLNLKLNFLTKNDIIGLSEVFIDDKYFNTFICSNQDTSVYSVDMRIVKLLVDSDDAILANKNIIVYHKYQVLANTLLKQRKIFFDSFFSSELHNLEINNSSNENENNKTNKNNNTDEKKNNQGESPKYNFVQNIIDISNKGNSSGLRSIQKINEIRSKNIEEKIKKIQPKQILVKNIKMINKKIQIVNNKKKLIRNLGDLDCMLINLSSNFTLSDKRLERSMIFRKQYFEKMEKLNLEKQMREMERQKRLENQSKLRRSESNIKNSRFQKCISIYKSMFKELPLLHYKDNNLKSDGQYKLIIPYNNPSLKKSSSTNNINPLAFDDFNRLYNTTQYFKFNGFRNYKEAKNLEDRKTEQKRNYFDYNIEFEFDTKIKEKKENRLIKSNSNLLTKKLRNIYKYKYNKLFRNKK